MVFGWGKKKEKKEEPEQVIRTEKEVQISEVQSILEEIQTLRSKTIISEVKTFRKKIESQLKEIMKITKELEHDDLNVEDIDKHLEILVVRGKKQVIEIIKKESSEKLPEIKSYEDVESLNSLVKQILKRMGDVLGRQSRVIHIFANKYAAKLKVHLSLLNSDRGEIQTLVDKHTQMNSDIEFILDRIRSHEKSKKFVEDTGKRILELKQTAENLEKKERETNQKISDFKSSEKYSKYLEAKKKIDSHLSTKHEIKNLIDAQFTKISRPLGRYEYTSSLDKPQKLLLENLVKNPFEVLTGENKDSIIMILSAVRKGVEGGSISVKDSVKSLSSIDETIENLENLISKTSQFHTTKNNLEKELETFDIGEIKQNENELEKISSDKTDASEKIQKLEQEITENKQKLPHFVLDIESKLQKVSSVKYHVLE